MVQASAGLAAELAAPNRDHPELEKLRHRWHFTVSEQRRLHRLLQRWQALAPEKEILDPELARQKTGKEVLRAIQVRIESLPVKLL